MSSVLHHTKCPLCDNTHHFCLTTGKIGRGDEYEYTWPDKGVKGHLRAATAGQPATIAMQRAVALSAASEVPV